MPAEDSFEEFFRLSFRRVVGQVFLLTGDLHEAEDLVQEAFSRALTRWRRIREFDAPEAWVRRVAFNLAANRARGQRRRLAILARLAPPPEVPPASGEVIALLEALRRLPMSQRQPVVLHYLLDLPVEQVAAEVGTSTGNVKVRLFRARRALAERLGSQQEEALRDG